LLLGISGAQGTGKSTLADFLAVAMEVSAGWRVAVLSLDDFYLTRAKRRKLAADVHPLLMTRGVPGTHDLQLLSGCLSKLRTLATDETLTLPRFDKGRDDRARPGSWPVVRGSIDAILLEGWCIGCPPQADDALLQPVNALERERDADGTWRRFVNEMQAGPYAELFAELDRLIYLDAPDFAAIHHWRLEQEQKLAARRNQDDFAVMDESALAMFIQHYERITLNCLEFLPGRADVVLELDAEHNGVRLKYRTPSVPA
jgi:D-glycerate 3-kinase